jgi:hypothetical protein
MIPMHAAKVTYHQHIEPQAKYSHLELDSSPETHSRAVAYGPEPAVDRCSCESVPVYVSHVSKVSLIENLIARWLFIPCYAGDEIALLIP